MIKCIVGDIFKGEAAVILQIVNCQGRANDDFSKKIKRMYPTIYAEYVKKCREDEKSKTQLCMSRSMLLGTIQCYPAREVTAEKGIDTIVNLFACDGYIGNNKYRLDYKMLRKCLQTVNEWFEGAKLSIPYLFSCDESEWETVSKIIKETLPDCDVTMYREIKPKYASKRDI